MLSHWSLSPSSRAFHFRSLPSSSSSRIGTMSICVRVDVSSSSSSPAPNNGQFVSFLRDEDRVRLTSCVLTQNWTEWRIKTQKRRAKNIFFKKKRNKYFHRRFEPLRSSSSSSPSLWILPICSFRFASLHFQFAFYSSFFLSVACRWFVLFYYILWHCSFHELDSPERQTSTCCHTTRNIMYFNFLYRFNALGSNQRAIISDAYFAQTQKYNFTFCLWKNQSAKRNTASNVHVVAIIRRQCARLVPFSRHTMT